MASPNVIFWHDVICREALRQRTKLTLEHSSRELHTAMSVLYFLFLFLWFINDRHLCFQIRVTVNDGGQTETAQFDVIEGEIPSFDVPASKSVKIIDWTAWNLAEESERLSPGSPSRSNEQSFWSKGRSGVSGKSQTGLTENAIRNTRMRRSQPDKWCNATESVSKVITVAKGDSVHLPCHTCVDNDLYESMQWVKLHPNPNRNNLYLVKEVLSDMHDDEKRNNLVINLKHTLIIRKARKSHTGSYICRPSTADEFEIHRMTWSYMQRWIVEDSRMRHFYHIDVVDFDKASTVETGNDPAIMNLEPFELIHENLVIHTKWLPWSACSVCDQAGMRQRIGLCVIKKRDSSVPVPHTYLNNILEFAGHGLSCQSEFLKEFDGRDWLDRPNEIQFDECFEKCSRTTRRRKRSTISVKEMSQSYEKVTKKKSIINIIVDDYLVLKCPGSKLLKKPVWMIGSQTISQIHVRKLTNKRINFDILGSIHFLKVKLTDTGVYSCWIDKRLKKKFEVRVKESQFKEVVKYGWYLGVSFLVDFVVFLILSLIKACHRRVQVRRMPVKKQSRSRDKLLKD